MKNYIKLMRLDHWIKQLFIVPGIVVAILLTKPIINTEIILKIITGLLATSLIASSNYVINEWLDAKFDKYHPTKKNRSAVINNLKKEIVYTLYFALALAGLTISILISKYLFITELTLWIMGILYNVKPFRLKDIAFIDSLSESINNALRFLMGWFLITSSYLPPISIILGYWLTGTFLMQMKRFSEYRMIEDKTAAANYRKSFATYNETSLLVSSIFYAILSVFFIGIFLLKYKIELILFMPFFIGLFCLYVYISFKKDSAVQKPEKLYKEKILVIYLIFLCVIFIILINSNIEILDIFTNNDLIPINK